MHYHFKKLVAFGATKPYETIAYASVIATNSASRTFPSHVVPCTLERIWAARTLDERAIVASISSIANAANLLVGVPRCLVHSSCFIC